MNSTYHRAQTARQLAAARLKSMGVSVGSGYTVDQIAVLVAAQGFGRDYGESNIGYLERFGRMGRVRAYDEVPARHLDRFTPAWRPVPHLRAAEIDALPSQVSMGGVGNGREDTTQFVRGK